MIEVTTPSYDLIMLWLFSGMLMSQGSVILMPILTPMQQKTGLSLVGTAFGGHFL
jgi:hypothetical protein